MSTTGVENEQTASDRKRLNELSEAQTTLENLPPELRTQVLCSIGDLRTLKSLVRSSPTYHEQYRLDRDKILRSCLETELDGFYIDAFATFKSRVCKLGKERTNEVITTFLGSYRQWLSGSYDSLAAASNAMSMDGSYLRWLSLFHQSTILPLTEYFCHWASTNLLRAAAAASSGNEVKDEPAATQKMDLSLISNSERIRIMRALYRCETYCHLFGRNKGHRWGFYRDVEVTELFFTIFQPWEAEEIGCIELFIRTKYTQVFNKVQADLHPKSPRFDDPWDGRGQEPDGSHELDVLWDGELISTTRMPLGDSKHSFGH